MMGLKTGVRESTGMSFHRIAVRNVLEENKRDHHEGADNPYEGDKEQENIELSGVQRIRSFIDLFTAGIFGHPRSPV